MTRRVGILPRAPTRHVVQRGATNVKEPNPGRPSRIGILQQEHGGSVLFSNVGAVLLIRSPCVFQPFRHTSVVGSDPSRHGNECAKFVETYLFVSFNAHNLDSYCVYFLASQKTFTSPSTVLNSGSPVRSSAFLILASAAAKQSA